MSDTSPPPVPMRLPCPECGRLHIDSGVWADRPHHSHACQYCGAIWRPAVIPTVGVRFLPGMRNEPDAGASALRDHLPDYLESLDLMSWDNPPTDYQLGHRAGQRFAVEEHVLPFLEQEK